MELPPGLRRELDAIRKLALEKGLTFHPTIFEIISKEQMVEYGTYILPARYSHWTFGREFGKLRRYSELGLLEILEMVVNLNPGMAFLLESNTDVENRMVIAHVFAHCDFFKNNYWFSKTDRGMLDKELYFERRIKELQTEHGKLEVEKALDLALSIQWHIDFYGQFRTEERASSAPPRTEEKDLVLYLARNGQLSCLQSEILELVHKESMYFFPNTITKIMNEGWATFWHAEILREYLSFDDFDKFAAKHAQLVSAKGLNPYSLGYQIYHDIRARWDELHGAGAGLKKIFEVRTFEDDVSFIRNYLSQEVCDKCGLYLFETDPQTGQRKIKSTDVEEIKKAIIAQLFNQGRPVIYVKPGKPDDDLHLLHKFDGRELDIAYARDMLETLQAVWLKPVKIESILAGKKIYLVYDGKEHRRVGVEEEEKEEENVVEEASKGEV